MPVIQGIVKAVSEKERNTKYGMKMASSINVDEVWYSAGFKGAGCLAGQEVQVNFDDTPYKNIVALRVIGGTPAVGTPPTSHSKPVGSTGGRTFPVGALAPERTINRQNALTNAVKTVDDYPITASDASSMSEYISLIIKTAREFEAYTCGDLDMQEAQDSVVKTDS